MPIERRVEGKGEVGSLRPTMKMEEKRPIDSTRNRAKS
jgi:hypothetical protein